jgi:hypothetical protein
VSFSEKGIREKELLPMAEKGAQKRRRNFYFKTLGMLRDINIQASARKEGRKEDIVCTVLHWRNYFLWQKKRRQDSYFKTLGIQRHEHAGFG